MIQAALPRSRVLQTEPLTDGLRHSNFKVELDSAPNTVVLRVYRHDPSLCRKELDLMRLVRDAVPTPEVIYAEPGGRDDLRPFAVRRYVEGVTFRQLGRGGSAEALAQASRSVGETLAAIGRYRFEKPGWIAPGLVVTTPLMEGADAMPRFVDQCLESPTLQLSVPAKLRRSIHDLMWSLAAELRALENDSVLVHCDYNKRNVLVREVQGRWIVAAVLDWEFAVSATPLIDVANFLRYNRAGISRAEPHFSAGFVQAGGRLPANWRYLAKVVDLTALCDSLTHEDLPDSVAPELVELARATVERRDPQLAS